MGIFKKLFGSDDSDILDKIDEIESEEDTCNSDDEVPEISNEELEEELTEDGELSYDEYDKVCCPECGEYLGEGVTVCKTCGYGKITSVIVCPKCGKTDEDHLGFCAYCDYEFETKK